MRRTLIATLALAFCSSALAQQHMLTTPDIHGDKVVFSSEGDLWLGSISGKSAERITSDAGTEANPRFSPDGKWIAFTGQYDGRNDVYLMPIEGGAPKRLTYDPYGADVEGWTPDGSSVIFRSRRQNPEVGNRLYTVPVSGGLPKPLPMSKASQGSFSPDGSRIAFVRLPLEEHHWKRYHGGEANSIWVLDTKSGQYKRIDDESINEQWPAWAADGLYYISEKEGSANIWRFDPKTGRRTRLTNHEGLDVRWLETDGKTLIYRFGTDLYAFDIASGKEQKLEFSMASDRIHARPTLVHGSPSQIAIGPTGKRLLLTSRGQLFSVASAHGEARPVANVLGTTTKLADWSPDGSTIAFVSDRTREENIWTVHADGSSAPVMLTSLTGMPIGSILWTPDSKKILYTDFASRLWLLDVASKQNVQVAETQYGGFAGTSFSSDSKWLAFAKNTSVYSTSLFLYEVATGKTTQLTASPMRDSFPTFDPAGKFLYFASERNVEPKDDGFDFQMDLQNTTKLYAIALAKDTASPLSPDTDEEPNKAKKAEEKKDAEKKEGEPAPTKIDLEGLSERIIELPVPAGSYHDLHAVDGRLLYVGEDGLNSFSVEDGKPKVTQFAAGVGTFEVSGDGKKMVVVGGSGLQVADTATPVSPGEGAVDLSAWMVPVDPTAEWKEIFEQAWRNHRDVFYDPGHHGQDWDAVHRRYAALLPAVGARNELNEILGEMIGEMNVSHEFVGGGFERVPKTPGPSIGSLGADLVYDSTAKAFKFTKILTGDGFSFADRSPLLTPGVGVQVGDYLFSIDGQAVSGDQDPNALLVGRAGAVVALQVGSTPDLGSARTVRVKTMPSDAQARYYDWVGSNRAYVAKKGGENLGYIHLPDMESAGITELSKWLYANLDKDGLVIDVRYNHGGIVSGQVLERLRRVIFEYDQGRYGAPVPYHRNGFNGHLVVLCNEDTASDGEYFCTGFRYMKLGPTVGTRTWGGFMAVNGFPMIDGGSVSTPVQGSFAPDGKSWLPDGTGFKPDYEVPEDPGETSNGRDPQLDKAIGLLKEAIAKEPVFHAKRLDPPSKEKAFKPNGKG